MHQDTYDNNKSPIFFAPNYLKMEINIFEVYTILNNIVSFLNERDKISLRRTNSDFLFIVENNFDLTQVLGKWRFAKNKIPSFNGTQLVNFTQISEPLLLSAWATSATLVQSSNQCYLQVASLIDQSLNHLFICDLPNDEVMVNLSGKQYIHYVNFYVYHFKSFSLRIVISDNMDFDITKIQHPKFECNQTSPIVLCDLCQTINECQPNFLNHFSEIDFSETPYHITRDYFFIMFLNNNLTDYRATIFNRRTKTTIKKTIHIERTCCNAFKHCSWNMLHNATLIIYYSCEHSCNGYLFDLFRDYKVIFDQPEIWYDKIEFISSDTILALREKDKPSISLIKGTNCIEKYEFNQKIDYYHFCEKSNNVFIIFRDLTIDIKDLSHYSYLFR